MAEAKTDKVLYIKESVLAELITHIANTLVYSKAQPILQFLSENMKDGSEALRSVPPEPQAPKRVEGAQ